MYIPYCRYSNIEIEYFKSCMKTNYGTFSKRHYDKLLTKLREMAFTKGLSRPEGWSWFTLNEGITTTTKGIFKKRTITEKRYDIVMKLRFKQDLTPEETKTWECILETLRILT